MRLREGPTSRRILTGLATVLFAGSTACAPAASPAADDPYFAGMGDTGYDAQHYRIRVRVDPDSGRLHGRTVVTARATRDLTNLRLELALRADTVTVNGRPARFRRGPGLDLVIQPADPVAAGGQLEIVVTYHGNPSHADTAGRPWLAKDGEQLGVGEPRIAPWWFPVNDHPRDKATYDVVGVVPGGRQFVSNGQLVARRGVGAETRWHWRSAEPLPSYATLFAAGDFQIVRERGRRPAIYAVSEALTAPRQRANLRLLRLTPGLVDWLETQFGPYPFGQTGGLVSGTFRNENWSMETQTRPTYPDLTQVSDARALLIHELAHQWFGDSVTPRRWRDIWLNEGFARWAEVRHAETHGGASARDWLRTQYRQYPAGARFWRIPVGDPGPDRLFAWAVYNRGAMAVQALRTRIGDDAFFTLLRRWTREHRWGNATIEQFEALAEQVSGQDLDSFFRAWLVDRQRPAATAANGL